MNYLKVYCNLIRKAENRTPPEGYTEKHHTFPVSIFGKNKRIVVLTAREHYIAHALLEKICIKRYGLKHWKTQKMIHAFWIMNAKTNKIDYHYNSLLYESSKIHQSKIVSEKMKGNKNSLGTVKSKEWIDKMVAINTGKKRKEETRNKISNKLKGRKKEPFSDDTRMKLSISKKGQKFSEEHKNNLKLAWKKRKLKMTEEERKNTFSGTKGKCWFYNDELKISKLFYPNEVPYGWIKGRKYIKKRRN
jgi:hypothetical protein